MIYLIETNVPSTSFCVSGKKAGGNHELSKVMIGVNDAIGDLSSGGYTNVKEDLAFDPNGVKYQMNIAMKYCFCKDFINSVIGFNRCKYFSGGIAFKIHLK